MTHELKYSEDIYKNFHANCSCGWHAQDEVQSTTRSLGENHVGRHKNDRRPDVLPKAQRTSSVPVNTPDSQKKGALEISKEDMKTHASQAGTLRSPSEVEAARQKEKSESLGRVPSVNRPQGAPQTPVATPPGIATPGTSPAATGTPLTRKP